MRETQICGLVTRFQILLLGRLDFLCTIPCIDLTLLVSDLIDVHHGGWDFRKLKKFKETNVERITFIRCHSLRKDEFRWG